MKTVDVTQEGQLWRVLDGGEPILSNRNMVDRGGFRTKGEAEKLAQDINARRARYSGKELPPAPLKAKAVEPVPEPEPMYGGLPAPKDGVNPYTSGGAARVADEVPFIPVGAVPGPAVPLLVGAPQTGGPFPGLIQGGLAPYGTQALLPPGGEAGMQYADCCSLANGWVGSSGPPAAGVTIAPVPFPTMPAGCNVGVKSTGNFHHHAVVAQP